MAKICADTQKRIEFNALHALNRTFDCFYEAKWTVQLCLHIKHEGSRKFTQARFSRQADCALQFHKTKMLHRLVSQKLQAYAAGVYRPSCVRRLSGLAAPAAAGGEDVKDVLIVGAGIVGSVLAARLG